MRLVLRGSLQRSIQHNRFLLRLLLFIGIAEESLGFRHLDHEERVELHHLLPFDHREEAAGIQHAAGILSVNNVDAAHFEEVTVRHLRRVEQRGIF